MRFHEAKAAIAGAWLISDDDKPVSFAFQISGDRVYFAWSIRIDAADGGPMVLPDIEQFGGEVQDAIAEFIDHRWQGSYHPDPE